MDVKRECCQYCHILLGEAEERVRFESFVFHPDCDKKRRQQTRLREFIIRHALENGLTIEPRHHFGR